MRRLSRGNKQKIGLIQAMFHRPPLLILDEPTSGLDPLVQEEFLEIVGEVRAEGRTVFFSSHVLSEVERVCDRVGIIRAGQLVAVESTREPDQQGLPPREPDLRRARGPGALRGAARRRGPARPTGERISFALHEPPDALVKLAASTGWWASSTSGRAWRRSS